MQQDIASNVADSMLGYLPCRTGLHVTDERSATVRNIVMGAAQARYVYGAGLVELGRDCGDLDVELRIGGRGILVFGTHSMSLERLAALVDEA